MQGKVGVGPASWLGWLTFAAGQIVFAATAIFGTKADLYGPGKWSAIGGAITLVATNFGRQLQAATGKGSSAPSLLPSDELELGGATQEWEAFPPEAAPVRRETSAVPDGAEQAPPPEAPPPAASPPAG